MNTPTTRTSDTSHRKAKHLSICTNPLEYTVEHGTAGFEHIRFIHSALPELDESRVDTSVSFVGTKISAPLLISCMTGGSVDGFRANRNLAIAAESMGIAVGMGSIRVLFENEELFEHFHLKRFAPSVPVLANIGGAQMRDIPGDVLFEIVRRLEADALVIHLNPGQELFQPDGDRNFRGIRDAIGRAVDLSPVPIIIKETGFGISPRLIAELASIGVAHVDVSGAGGTNWISVESYRGDEAHFQAAGEFDHWGLPTAFILSAVRRLHGIRYDRFLLASGGLRSGQDVAKSIALGAEMAGAALPFIRAESTDGVEGVVSVAEQMVATLRRVMVLTACGSIAELRSAPTWSNASFASEVALLCEASNE